MQDNCAILVSLFGAALFLNMMGQSSAAPSYHQQPSKYASDNDRYWTQWTDWTTCKSCQDVSKRMRLCIEYDVVCKDDEEQVEQRPCTSRVDGAGIAWICGRRTTQLPARSTTQTRRSSTAKPTSRQTNRPIRTSLPPRPATSTSAKHNTPPPPTDQPASFDAFQEEALSAHNKLRAMHGSPPLELSASLNAYAQKWADELASRPACSLFPSPHSPNNPNGENVAAMGTPATASAAVELWYDEVKDYDFNDPKFDMSTGHFTQLVWKASEQLGIGRSSCNGKVFVVAEYHPPGNYRGEFTENVLPRKD